MFYGRGLALSMLLLATLTGCSNNGQTFNPWIGYGSPRIPAPSTGSAGVAGGNGAVPDPYYGGQPGSAVVAPGQTSFATPAGVGPQAFAQPSGWQASAAQAPATANRQAQPQPNPAIATVGFEQPVADSPAQQQAAQGSSVLQRIQNQRMHVNDAAAPAAPQTFVPPQTVQPISGAIGTGVANPGAYNAVAPQRVPGVTALPAGPVSTPYQWGAAPAGYAQVAQSQPAMAYGVLASGTTAPQAAASQANVASTAASTSSELGWRSKSADN